MVSAQVDIKSPAGMSFESVKEDMPRLAHLLPDAIQGLKYSEGNEIRDGAVVCLKYNIGEYGKESVTGILSISDSW